MRSLARALAELDAAAALAGAAVAAPAAGAAQRLMRELRAIARAPHPAFDVYPTESLQFWRVVVEGPSETVYAGGAWLTFVKFPAAYPATPPEFKFVTPIKVKIVSSWTAARLS